MTKDELIADMESKSFFGGWITEEQEYGDGEPDGTKYYRRSYWKESEKVMTASSVDYGVKSNGICKYKGQEPV